MIDDHNVLRKTHINKCVSALNDSKLKATEMYGLLSEMVHPNFGSNSLVIVTRNRFNDAFGEVVLSSNPRNIEAAAWFFELAAEPLSQIFQLERGCIFRSQNLLKSYQTATTNSLINL